MPIRAITFDCAGTLIDVDWQPAAFATDCVERLGIPVDRALSESNYTRLLQTRWRHYQQLNLSRDEKVCDGFWQELTRDWMAQTGIDPKSEEAIWNEAWQGLYGSQSRVFKLFDDSLEALQAMKSKGLKIAAVSNWDYSLHRVLKLLKIDVLFDVVVASLEEGMEKPDPKIFQIALDRLGANASNTIHVGDSPLDDVQGARNAGLHAILLDRRIEATPSKTLVSDLRQLSEVLDWIG